MASSVVTLSLPFHYLFYYLRVLKLALKETCWLIRTYIQYLMVPIKLNVHKLSARMQWLGPWVSPIGTLLPNGLQ